MKIMLIQDVTQDDTIIIVPMTSYKTAGGMH